MSGTVQVSGLIFTFVFISISLVLRTQYIAEHTSSKNFFKK